MKKSIAIILAIAIIAVTSWATMSCVYPRYGKIRAVEYDTDLVYIEDLAGLMWIYKGVEDLFCEDPVAMLMFNNFTPNYIYDDVIVTIH